MMCVWRGDSDESVKAWEKEKKTKRVKKTALKAALCRTDCFFIAYLLLLRRLFSSFVLFLFHFPAPSLASRS